MGFFLYLSFTVPSRNSIPGCGGKPRLIRQPAMHDELSIDMSSSSPPRLGVRFLPTIPSAADSSIIMDDTESGGVNDNAAELLARQDSNGSEGLVIIAHTHDQVVGALVAKSQEEGLVESGNSVLLRIGEAKNKSSDVVGGGGGEQGDEGKEKCDSDSSAPSAPVGSYQTFYTVLGCDGNTLATLASPQGNEERRPP